MINLHRLGDAVIYMGALAAAMAAIGILLRWVVVRPLKSWISEEIREPLSGLRTQIAVLTKRFDDHLVNYHQEKDHKAE